MKRKYFKIISILLIALVITTLVVELNDINSKTVVYDANIIKKIAYDYLSEDIKSKVVTSQEAYHANEDTALNVEKIWLYASCDEIKLKTIGHKILWIGSEIKERYDTFSNRNKIILKVSMDTSDTFLPLVILFVDPVNNEVIGYGMTF